MNPRLIVGLGGMGSRVTNNIYKKFLEGKPVSEERDKLVCLCLDTDENDLRIFRRQMPADWVLSLISPAQRHERPFKFTEHSWPSRSLSLLSFQLAEKEERLQAFEDALGTLKTPVTNNLAFTSSPRLLAILDRQSSFKPLVI